MEFDEIVMKESPGLCRCCLSEGCYKDMGTEYAWMSENEVYADMLLECFDISISQHHDGPNGPNRLICEVCITRLRDACYFKKQVLDSEKKFIDMVGRGEFRPKAMIIYQQDLKAETSDEVKVIFEPENAEVLEEEYLEDEMEFGDDEPLKSEDPEPTSSDVTAVPLPVRGKRGRPRKTPAKPEKKKVKTEPKAKSSKALVKDEKPDKMEERQTERTRRMEVCKLVEMIIKWSTVIPFRWHECKYMCFYCDNHFTDSSGLKEHLENHPDVNLNGIFIRIVYNNYRIKLDVSQIGCIKCKKGLDSFANYLEHLSNEHKMQFSEDVVAQFELFKLNDKEMQCLECYETFNHFSHLLSHTHRKHNVAATRNYLCEICGQSFWMKGSIYNHMKQIHEMQKCKYCGESFKTRYSLSLHIGNVHETDKFKCSFCDKVFPNRYLKKRHLAIEHDCKSEQLFCDICNKMFTRRVKLLQHKERMHSKDMKWTCEFCGVTLDIGSLKSHLRIHNDVKLQYQCNYCNNFFKDVPDLELHLCTDHYLDKAF